jgi:lipoprotein-anchoring transpeptidase ErfK/SrfK
VQKGAGWIQVELPVRPNGSTGWVHDDGVRLEPVPTGRFCVTDRVRPDEPDGPYGAFGLGLSAHSPTLTEFAGSGGQVGIHGTNRPGSIGQAVSHGCIRVPASVTAVLARVPLGTPVVIH